MVAVESWVGKGLWVGPRKFWVLSNSARKQRLLPSRSLCSLIGKRRIIEPVCFTRVFSKSTAMIMNCSSLMSNEKVSYGCSNPHGCAQLWFWKQFAAGEGKPLWGAPGPADATPLLPASSHRHHVFPISLSFAFPFRPVFLAIIVHHLPDAKSP